MGELKPTVPALSPHADLHQMNFAVSHPHRRKCIVQSSPPKGLYDDAGSWCSKRTSTPLNGGSVLESGI
ncbi:hypothetical protein TorRG33x02_329790 [Trema orientale]|uniref:Uncharacterized protein n=1 Tax=Trema orientale TaxID=63057 RepID=A0A2P5B8C9_TREOI|nr:hypothetical protein TorRG33x02_329790 [Trema orientale]